MYLWNIKELRLSRLINLSTHNQTHVEGGINWEDFTLLCMLLISTEKVPEIISPGIILSAVFTYGQSFIQVKII